MPAHPNSSDLTGATRYRNGWFGSLVLQVEETYAVGYRGRPRINEPTHCEETRWRDAKATDLRTLDWFDGARNRPLPTPVPGKPRR